MSTEVTRWLGQTLGGARYRIRSELGAGGMGFVLLADDLKLHTPVVVKVPRPAMLLEAGFAGRFTREIQSMIKLAHPRIVRVLDVGEHEGQPYAVMQFLAGGSLKDRITRGKPSASNRSVPERPQNWLGPIAEALDFVHAEGYLHRDIKPDNILFDERGNPFLSDFGVAKVLADGQRQKKTVYTSDGAVLGTPQYMAPEMILAGKVDGRVDQYALAVTLYECLAGRLPFIGPNPTAIFVQQVKEKAPPLGEVVSGMPAGLSEVVARALNKDPRERFANCRDFANAVLHSFVALHKAAPVPVAAPAIPTARPFTPPQVQGTGVVRLECPHCHQTVKATEDLAGRKVKCPHCGGNLGKLDQPATQLAAAGSARETLLAGRSETAGVKAEVPATGKAAAGPSRWRLSPRALAALGGTLVCLIAAIVFGALAKKAPKQAPAPVNQPTVLELLAPLNVEVEAGETAKLALKIKRMNWRGVVQVKPVKRDPQIGLEGQVAADAEEGVLTLIVSRLADVGERTVPLELSGVGTSSEASLVLTVRPTQKGPPSITIQPLTPITLEPGKSKTVEVRVLRSRVRGPISLRLDADEDGLTARGEIPDGQNEGTVQLAAAPGLKDGVRLLLLRAEGKGVVTRGNWAVTVRSPGSEPERKGRATLAIDIEVIDAFTRKHWDLKLPKETPGAVVVYVTPQGGGDRLGLQAGDVLVKVNETEITSHGHAWRLMKGHTLGEHIRLGIIRGKERLSLSGRYETNFTIEEQVRAVQKDADAGKLEALCYLGEAFMTGISFVPRDTDQGRFYLKKAVARDYAPANYAFAAHLFRQRPPVDLAEGLTHYRAAAQQGHRAAQLALGNYHYSLGEQDAKEYKDAYQWFLRAALQSEPEAQHMLGWMFNQARGVERDYTISRTWYEEAAKRGNSMSINNLGWMYQHAEGVEKDLTRAIELYEQAAGMGNAVSMRNLGTLYEGLNNRDKAIAWFKQAADKGEAFSKKRLKTLLEPMQAP